MQVVYVAAVEGEKKKRSIPYLLVGLAVLAAVPLAMKWADLRVEDPVTRLHREKGEISAAILAMAKKDLPCESSIELREPNGELWAYGCGKRARYVLGKDGAFSLSGAVEADDECVVRWSREADAGDAREAAAKVHAASKPARLRIPVTAFGVTGLAKLRYGEHVEVVVEADAGEMPDAVVVPCIEDGGIREGRCTKEWSAVAEVAECPR
ncbi:hypothetical protein BH11MYX4_BH11MYX4_41670 [soil metagenome]